MIPDRAVFAEASLCVADCAECTDKMLTRIFDVTLPQVCLERLNALDTLGAIDSFNEILRPSNEAMRFAVALVEFRLG
jgi:hypothetical protein